jgi:CBS domain-containing protein
MPRKGLTCADIMTTALITMRATETVKRADIDMKLAAIRHIPVVDDRQRLIGIVSNRDVLRALGTAGDSVVVGTIMTKRVRTVAEDTPAHEAAGLMLEYKIGALPVIGDEQQLVGMITETDFLALAQEALARA